MARVRSPVYFFKINDTLYVSWAMPSSLGPHFHKRRITIFLRTQPGSKTAVFAAALHNRLGDVEIAFGLRSSMQGKC